MSEESSWIERAKSQVAYHKQAVAFLERVGRHFPVGPSDTGLVSRLWVEADQLDDLVCGLLEEMNTGLLDRRGTIDTTRGASPCSATSVDDGVAYECSWSLLWGNGPGVSVCLATDTISAGYRVRVRALQDSEAEAVRFPVREAELKDALTAAYVAEATAHDPADKG